MNSIEIEAYLEETYPDKEIILADGFEKQFLGVGRQFKKLFAVYDKNSCISQLMEENDMKYDEAEEYFLFNVQDAYVGENTPIFIETIQNA